MTTREDYLSSIHASINDLIDADAPIEVWRSLDANVAVFRDNCLNDVHSPARSQVEILEGVVATLKDIDAKLSKLTARTVLRNL
jgi:hypothetical protein